MWSEHLKVKYNYRVAVLIETRRTTSKKAKPNKSDVLTIIYLQIQGDWIYNIKETNFFCEISHLTVLINIVYLMSTNIFRLDYASIITRSSIYFEIQLFKLDIRTFWVRTFIIISTLHQTVSWIIMPKLTILTCLNYRSE